MTASTPLMLLAAATMQQVPVVQLGPADARSSEGFTNIFAVHELADGRVLVTDNLENAVRSVDFRAGTIREIGRTGSGPMEYRSATTILPWRGDTVLITDNAQRRFVRIAEDRIVGAELQPQPLLDVRNFSAPLADVEGRFYFDVRNLEFRDDGVHERAGHLIRWAPDSPQLDTVATIDVTRHSRRVNQGYNPFPFRTAWGVAADGAIVLIRAEPYRVEWIRNRQRTSGPVIGYDRVRIDDAERDAERLAFTRRGRGALRFQSRTTERPSVDAQLRSRLPDDVFPPYKPPFTDSRVLVSPNGDVWIPRAASWDADWTLIDVVGRDGRLRQQVRMPANRRVVGFGRATVYVSARDENDLQWLERFRLPSSR